MTSPRPASLPRAALAFVSLAALGAVGCMQSDTSTTILADGSGTCSETVVVDLKKTKEIVDAAKMFGAMQGAQGGGQAGGQGGLGGLGSIPENFDSDKWLSEQYSAASMKAALTAIPGVEVKSVTSEKADGKITAKREFAFADLGGVGQVLFTIGTAELKKNDDGSWTLDMDAVGLLRTALAAAAAEAGGGAGGAGPGAGAGGFGGIDVLGFLGQMLGDFRVKRSFTVPGTIVETNGTKSEDGKTATWTFKSEDLAKASGDVTKAPGKMSVKFKGDGLTLKPFKYAPDLQAAMKAMQPKPAAPAAPAAPATPTTPKDPTPPK